MSKNLEIDDYSEKAIVVRGDTNDHKEALVLLGGKWNERLRDGPGWIFPKTKRSDIVAWQKNGKLPAPGSFQQPMQQPMQQSSGMSVSDSRVIMTKLNKMENTLAAILKQLAVISGEEVDSCSEEEEASFVPPQNGGRLLKR
jgi:hypothetical protein